MRILIINGPNLNLLGKREVNIYGSLSFEIFFDKLKSDYPFISFDYFQSNIEGEIINKIQEAENKYDSLIINAGGYAHTSVAIADALAYLTIPSIDVHISNIFKRDDYRKTLLTAEKTYGSITGFGLLSYKLAVEALISMNKY